MSNVALLTYPGNGASSPVKKRRRSLSSIFKPSLDKPGALSSTNETHSQPLLGQTSPTDDGRKGYSAQVDERAVVPTGVHAPLPSLHSSSPEREQSIKMRSKWNPSQPTSPTTRFTSVARIHPKDLKSTLAAVYEANTDLASVITEWEEADFGSEDATSDVVLVERTVPRQTARKLQPRSRLHKDRPVLTAKTANNDALQNKMQSNVVPSMVVSAAGDLATGSLRVRSPRLRRRTIEDVVPIDQDWTTVLSPKSGVSAPSSLHKPSRPSTPDVEPLPFPGSKENIYSSLGRSRKPRRKSISEFAKVVFRSTPPRLTAPQEVLTGTTSAVATY
ncbi:hypothetical protein FRC02_010649 [Tulasnella sp. 418]|nr:hypothetical protein FRC02_010649 [Tulasnella sp. 418]